MLLGAGLHKVLIDEPGGNQYWHVVWPAVKHPAACLTVNHLCHESRAIHAAYAGRAQVAVLPLEFYEAQKLKNVVQFSTEAAAEAIAEPEARLRAMQGERAFCHLAA